MNDDLNKPYNNIMDIVKKLVSNEKYLEFVQSQMGTDFDQESLFRCIMLYVDLSIQHLMLKVCSHYNIYNDEFIESLSSFFQYGDLLVWNDLDFSWQDAIEIIECKQTNIDGFLGTRYLENLSVFVALGYVYMGVGFHNEVTLATFGLPIVIAANLGLETKDYLEAIKYGQSCIKEFFDRVESMLSK